MVGELSILSQPGMPDSPQPMLTLISVVTICSHASTRKNEPTVLARLKAWRSAGGCTR